MLPFRVIVVDDSRKTLTVVAQLERTPQIGERLTLPHGDTVIVRHITSADKNDVAGIILAASP